MSYEIKLYAHGVPKGHDTWNVENFDSNYIKVFYGRKSNVPTLMLVEVRQFASSAYCYYTYLRTGNVCDNDGRSGGYFALTLRINYYYADIQNIYNLLDAAYNKYIVSTVVSVNDGAIKYLVANFAQVDVDVRLKELEKDLVHYLMRFSSNSDFVPLSGFKTNAQNGPVEVNIHECDMNAIADCVKRNGSVSASPLYPSTKEQEMTNEINKVKRDAQTQIGEARQNAKNEVENANRQKEKGIEAVRKQYKKSDSIIESLRKKIDSLNKEKEQYAADCKKKNEDAKKHLEDIKVLLDKVYDAILLDLSGISADPRENSKTAGEGSNEGEYHKEKGHSSLLKRFVQKTHPLVLIIIVFVLFVIIVGVILSLILWAK